MGWGTGADHCVGDQPGLQSEFYRSVRATQKSPVLEKRRRGGPSLNVGMGFKILSKGNES